MSQRFKGLEKKVIHAKNLIRQAIKKWPKIAIACSFGKDSLVTLHLSRLVYPKIKVFSVMTIYKPPETFEYLILITKLMNFKTKVYLVADKIPDILKKSPNVEVILLPVTEFKEKSQKIKRETGKEIYQINPDECCRLLKVEPTKVALKNLDAWIAGLRTTESPIRKDYQEIEENAKLVKINPILEFTEAEIWRYIATRRIPPHPFYGKGYRSLGCAPCSQPGGKYERDGRWFGTSKCGGECGIHTKKLK